jgi:MFS family permease
MMMTSLATHYWQVMLAQGIVVGLGMGCLFTPAAAIIPTWFSTRKAAAIGLAASGSSIGGVIYPIIFRQLQPQIGAAWATRVIAFVALAGMLFALAVMRTRIPPRAKRLIELGAWKEPPFAFFVVGNFFGFMGTYIPLFYLQTYAIQRGYTDENLGFYLLAILNAGSTFGRIIPNFIADKAGTLNILVPTSLAAAILTWAWIGIQNGPGVVVFAVLYGFFSGTYVSLAPITTVTLSPSLDVVGARMGMVFAVASLGLLIGTPIGGAILEHSWVGLQSWGAACIVVATFCMIGARVSKAGFKLKVKA